MHDDVLEQRIDVSPSIHSNSVRRCQKRHTMTHFFPNPRQSSPKGGASIGSCLGLGVFRTPPRKLKEKRLAFNDGL